MSSMGYCNNLKNNCYAHVQGSDVMEFNIYQQTKPIR